MTDDHPIWVKDFGWLDSINLVPGLEVERRDGKTLTVIDFKYLNKVETTYNLEVSDWHTYYVGDAGLLVHNQDCPQKKKKVVNSEPGEKVRTPDSYRSDFNRANLGNRQFTNINTRETWTRERPGRDHRGEAWDVTDRSGSRVGDVWVDGEILRRTNR